MHVHFINLFVLPRKQCSRSPKGSDFRLKMNILLFSTSSWLLINLGIGLDTVISQGKATKSAALNLAVDNGRIYGLAEDGQARVVGLG